MNDLELTDKWGRILSVTDARVTRPKDEGAVVELATFEPGEGWVREVMLTQPQLYELVHHLLGRLIELSETKEPQDA